VEGANRRMKKGARPQTKAPQNDPEELYQRWPSNAPPKTGRCTRLRTGTGASSPSITTYARTAAKSVFGAALTASGG
jgi:hypothetical protein